MPEFFWIITNGFGGLGDGDFIGMQEEVFKLPLVAIKADVLASVTERIGRASQLLQWSRTGKELPPLSFHPLNHLLGDSMIHHLEKPIVLASLEYSFHDVGHVLV